MNSFVLPLSDPQVRLEIVGGKGASLAKLVRAGLPVPDGFHVTTAAYREFVAANNLQASILNALEGTDAADPASLERVSQEINRVFARGRIPADLANAIVSAYTELCSRQSLGGNKHLAVAVRSSATAEDLPEASFAGQQETYLNIQGSAAVLEAVQKCWASLWTGRAIAYRSRQSIPHERVALAVVIQVLVPAETAGILFTANPLNGKRDEIIINAAWGLGEAIVGGLVTPDTITVDRQKRRVLRRETAEKMVMTVRGESGTAEQPVPDHLKKKPVLTAAQAAELARLGVKIEELYNRPMDIEWAWQKAGFAILQARPITTLGEAPLEWKPPLPKGIYMRASMVDLLPDPLSPLFSTLGIPAFVAQMYPLARDLTRMDAVLPEDYFTTINMYAYMNAGYSGRGWLWVLFGLLPAYPRLLRMLIPFWRDEARPKYQKIVAELRGKDITGMSSADLWREVQMVMDAAASYTSVLMFATMGASAGSEGLLTRVYEKLARREGDPPATVLLMGWDNLPIRAEKSLFDLAEFCRQHESLSHYIQTTPSSELVERMAGDDIPAGLEASDWQELRQRLNRHLDEFGYMIFDLDFAKLLPRDHPEPMLEVIKMHLRGEGVNPYERQKASEVMRIQTAETTLKRLKGLRRWAFRVALNWAQSLSAVREDALADIGLGYPALRRMLHILGERLVKAGALDDAGDIYWLEKEEVADALINLESGAALASLRERIGSRKAFWQKMKQTTPPPVLPPRKSYMGINLNVWLPESEGNQAETTLKGVSASPGKVTGPACVLHGPEDFDRMRLGDVLVAGTTTPAWTPLFAMASAVVTDIGGPLSHGSIVAREYGIPAVMGTGVATRRIRDGQTIMVDGSAGVVILKQ